MVLRPKNFAKSPANENQSPADSRAVAIPKGLVSRLGLADASHRRRSKTSGMTRTTKYAIEQAKRRNDMAKKAAKSPMLFKVTRAPAVNDVVMGDSSSSSPQAKVTQLYLPKDLGRPEYKEIDKEVIEAIDATAADTDIEYIREGLESISTDLAMSLTSTKIQTTRDKLPKELAVIVNDMCSILPSHVLAVFDGQAIRADPARPRKVTLYPVHSLVLAANCAHMPKPPATLPVPVHQGGEQEVTLPVWSLALPSPQTYPHLSVYLYTKRVDRLMAMMLPSPPPADCLENKGERVLSFAKHLSQTFTVQALTRHIFAVHGLWQNVCTMGIFDTRLWDAIDWMWATLLTALAIATGDPALMIPSASEQQQQQQQ